MTFHMKRRMLRAAAGVCLVLLVSLSVLACAGGPPPSRGDASAIGNGPDGKQVYGLSVLDNSGPIPVLVLRGTPYEQGFAYGALMRDRVADVIKASLALRDASLAKASWLERMAGEAAISRAAADFAGRTPQSYREEMRGLADGSGQRYEDIVFLSSGATMLMACTSVLAPLDGAAGIVHGRNFDFSPYFLAENPVLVRYESEGKIPYWNIGVIGYLASFNGCNDKGISLSINISDSNEAKPDGLPMGWKLREILSGADSLERVRAVVHATRNDNINWMLTAASASESAGIVFDLKDDVQAEASTKRTEPMVVLNRAFGDGRHDEDGLARAHANPMETYSEFNLLRWEAAQRFLATNTIKNPDDMWALLRDHSGSRPEFYTTAGTIVNDETLFSIVFDLAKHEFSIATGSSWAALRQVWRFDTLSSRFEPFLPDDVFVTSPAFKEAEKTYLSLAKAQLDGRLSLDMVTDALGPYALFMFGMDAVAGPGDEKRLAAMLESQAERNPEVWLVRLASAYLKRKADPKAYVSIIEAVLKEQGLNQVDELGFLGMLADAYAKDKNAEGAKSAAVRWLDRAAKISEACSTKGYIDSKMKAMVKMAGEKK